MFRVVETRVASCSNVLRTGQLGSRYLRCVSPKGVHVPCVVVNHASTNAAAAAAAETSSASSASSPSSSKSTDSLSRPDFLKSDSSPAVPSPSESIPPPLYKQANTDRTVVKPSPEKPQSSSSSATASASTSPSTSSQTSSSPSASVATSSTSDSSSPSGRSGRSFKSRTAPLTITAEAVERLKSLSAPSSNSDSQSTVPTMLRIGVRNKGCAGMSYHLDYVDKPGRFDEVVEQDGVKVLIDSKALFSIIGSHMDWQEDALSAKFVFSNPNIKEECGCGESFLA